MRHRATTVSIAICLAAVADASGLAAQQVECIEPQSVTCEKPTRADHELIVVRLTDPSKAPAANILVSFSASDGTVTDTARTDAAGVAHAKWAGDKTNQLVDIQVSGWAGGPARKTIKLGTASTPEKVKLVTPVRRPRWYDVVWSPEQQWYQSRQVKKPDAIVLDGISDTLCARTALLFHAYGDKPMIAPDTGFGVLVDHRCEVRFQWTLGGGVGKQTMRATLVGDAKQHLDLVAKSRALPWLGMGIAQTWDKGYVTAASKKTPLKIVRKLLTPAGDSLEISYDSSKTSPAAPDTIKRQSITTPIVAVNFPLILRLERLRLSIAADMAHPDRNWFFGVSLLQISAGFQHEDIGFDLHALAHFARRDVVTNLAECTATTPSPPACETHSTSGYVGYGVLAIVNTSSVLEKLIAALLPKS